MIKFFEHKNILNFILLLWVLFIPFKDAIYQISTSLIILYFLVYLVVNKDYMHLKQVFLKYKDLVLITLLITLSMTLSNLLNNVSEVGAWKDEITFLYRYILVFFILIYLYSRHLFSKKTLLIFILISLSIQSIDSIYQSFEGYDLFKNRPGNLHSGLSGSTFNKNVFGMLMGIALIIPLFLFNNKSVDKSKKIFLSILFISFLFGFLFSYTRSAWVSFFFIFFIYTLTNIKKFTLKQFLFYVGFFILIALVFFNIDSLHNQFVRLFEGKSNGRYEIWSHAVNLIVQKPFFGWGLDTWRIHGAINFNGIHNSVLEILFCLGLVGFVVFTILIQVVFKTIYFYKDFNLFLISTYFFVFSLFEQNIIRSTIFLSCLTILMFYIFSNRIKDQK